MDNKAFIEFTPTVAVVFFISLLTYVFSSYYKTNNAQAVFDSREVSRGFAIKLSQELHNKAGIIISNNNFDPIMPATLLRVMLRMPEGEIESYQYDKNLTITTTGKNKIIDVRDIVNYAQVSKKDNNYTIYLD